MTDRTDQQAEGNVIVTGGVTFFANTVVGTVDQTGNIVTVRSLMADWGHTIQAKDKVLEEQNTRIAELSDALRVLIDEGTELINNKAPYNIKNMERGLELGVKVLAGK